MLILTVLPFEEESVDCYAENDKALDTATCLKCDTSGRYHVQALLAYCILNPATE